MKERALVIGLGSIGTRHRQILTEFGLEVASVSRRGGGDFTDVPSAIAAVQPGYVVIATETGDHYDAVEALAQAGYDGRVLTEKPLFERARPIPEHRFAAAYVGYNMRFHPVITAVRGLVAGEEILAVRAEVGQHFSEWRPGRDQAQSYSARRSEGGGVLRDLSHEIDYLLWLFGPCRQVTAKILASRTLGIETDDVAAILMTAERCPIIQLSLDYHRRPAGRDLVVTTASRTIIGDVLNGRVWINGAEQALDGGAPTDRNATYAAMHRAALAGSDVLATFGEALAVLAVIDAAEWASESRSWIAL